MSYWIPSHIQKRLLRYALSQLELLDTDSLDLEQLDIAWGNRTSVELRDVGLQLHKIAKLTNLPASIRPVRGLIRSVQLTVPANIFTNGIQIAISGVELYLQTVSSDEPKLPQNAEDHIPSTEDVAEGFLAEEPAAEIHELEAAILSQSMSQLDSSSADNQDGDETDRGTGVDMALPGFLAGFLTGIADRLEITICDVVFSINFDVPARDLPPSWQISDKLAASIGLNIDEIEVTGISSSAVDDASQTTTKGRRKIDLKGIRANLTSQRAFFASLSQISSRSSPVASQKYGSPMLSRLTSSPPQTSTSPTSQDETMSDVMQQSSSSFPTGSTSLPLHPTAIENPLISSEPSDADKSQMADDRERFADASDDEDEITESMLSSQLLTSGELWPSFEAESDLSAKSQLENFHDQGLGLTSTSVRSTDEQLNASFRGTDHELSMRPLQPKLVPHSSLMGSASASASASALVDIDDEMAESKFFTHEEARSMYESAMSTITPEADQQSSGTDGQRTPREPHHEIPTTSSTPQRHTESSQWKSDRALHDTEQQNPQTPISQSTGPPEQLMETKTLFSIDLTRMWVPWANGNADVVLRNEESANIGVGFQNESQYASNMPGAFDSEPEPIEESKLRFAPSNGDNPQAQFREDANYRPNIEVEIGIMQGQIDLAAGRLSLVLLEQILSTSSISQSAERAGTAKSVAHDDSDSSVLVGISVSRFRLALQEHLGIMRSTWDPDGLSGALMNLTLQDFRLNIRNSRSLKVTGASIAKFALGIPGQDIIKFGTPSDNASSRITISSVQPDLEVKYIESRSRGREMHVFTSPVLVVIDMLKIDERLECFGGLSGVLDISNTIASQSTVLAPVTHREARPSSKSSAIGEPNQSALKANVVLNGVHVDVRGRSCAVTLSSRTVTLGLDSCGLKVELPKVRLKGPVQFSSSRRSPLSMTIVNTTLRFIFQPEEEDLSTLLSLIAPTHNPYEDDDDILIDTLLRQRKQGSVFRATVEDIDMQVTDMEAVGKLQSLVEELAKLSSVTKYLPDDDRPGILTIVSILELHAAIKVNRSIGKVELDFHRLSLAHVGLPALFALQTSSIRLSRNEEILVGPLLPIQLEDRLPMLMLKIIGDELEPTIKVKLYNLALEYRVSTLMSIMGATAPSTTEDLAASIVSSIATIKEQALPAPFARQSSVLSDESSRSAPKSMKVDVLLRDCAAGMNPGRETSRGVFLLEHAQFGALVSVADPVSGGCDIYKATLLAVDDTSGLDMEIEPARRAQAFDHTSIALHDLGRQGYRNLGTLSSLHVSYHVDEHPDKASSALTVDVTSELLVLETCADSTQTLISIIDGLKLPSAPSEDLSYYNDPMSAADLLNSFSGDGYDEGELPTVSNLMHDYGEDDGIFPINDEFEVVAPEDRKMSFNSVLEDSMVSVEDEDDEDIPAITRRHINQAPFSDAASLKTRSDGDPLNIISHHMHTIYAKGAIHGWHSASNRYGIIPEVATKDCPLKLNLRLQTFIWNMFDGYDWAKTREVINQAVENVQQRVAKRRSNVQRYPARGMDDDESEIGDFLFQSIWIAVPPNKDEGDLRRRIAREMDDVTSETGTMTTTATESSNRPMLRQRRSRNLKLDRGKRQKVSIEVRNLGVNVLVLPPSIVETQSSIDIQVGDLEIYDHVPSSTWRKFITYMREAGPRPEGKPMIHFEVQNVKPKPELAATEMVIRVTVLPLRLHVDQDTLDFITRFFEFKDTSRVRLPKTGEEPFIQRIEVRAVAIKLDYKPKKVDYAGLRSGRAKEFMNFIILDGADILLKRLIVFGVSGFDRLNKILNDLWVSDVTSNQLPTVLQGLAPLRPLVNVGTGVRNLIVVPMQEYQKDGRLVRSLGKGAIAFAKTTTSELARLGARVAIGTGNILQGAETMLSPGLSTSPGHGQDYDSDSYLSASPSSRVVSSYANQPLTVASGLRSAVKHLERDLLSARDAIIAVGADIRESDNAGELARAVFRGAPAVILKPAIGTTKAFGTALLGAGNALDAESRSRLEDKYKP